MPRLTRQQVVDGLARHYSTKLKGKVWACYDPSSRRYEIRGDNLPAHPDMQALYPNGWSMLDYIKPHKAHMIARGIACDCPICNKRSDENA